jgi:hypothetical protein
LLEAVVALAVLALAGSAVVGLEIEAGSAVRHAANREAEVTAASRFLEFVALWPREDLERHFGTHRQGSWLLGVERPSPDLYTLTLSDGATGETLLRTAVYRPAGSADDSSR